MTGHTQLLLCNGCEKKPKYFTFIRLKLRKMKYNHDHKVPPGLARKSLLHLMHTSRLWSLFLSCEERTVILRGEITLCIIQWLDAILEENSLPVSEQVYLLICNARSHQNRIKGTCWSKFLFWIWHHPSKKYPKSNIIPENISVLSRRISFVCEFFHHLCSLNSAFSCVLNKRGCSHNFNSELDCSTDPAHRILSQASCSSLQRW